MQFNLMFITSFFVIEPRWIRGGISYRYVGLYGSIIKALDRDSRVYWYSIRDSTLRIVCNSSPISEYRFGLLRAGLRAISETLKRGLPLIVIIAYPYGIPKVLKVHEYFALIFVLKLASVMKRAYLLVDDFDPPVEAAYVFSKDEPPGLLVLYYRARDFLTFRLATVVMTVSESFGQYFGMLYRITEKILVVPNGCLMEYVEQFPPRKEGSIMVLYAGHALKVNDVDKLVMAVKGLRERGLQIDLTVAGRKMMDLPAWVDTVSYEWPTFIEKVISKADICVIPYSPSFLFRNFASPAKLYDYMAAGKPIVSTNLKETAIVLRGFGCGLVARDWKEFQCYIETLYYDRELCRKLGENGRKAAEIFFDYNILANRVLGIIHSLLIGLE